MDLLSSPSTSNCMTSTTIITDTSYNTMYPWGAHIHLMRTKLDSNNNPIETAVCIAARINSKLVTHCIPYNRWVQNNPTSQEGNTFSDELKAELENAYGMPFKCSYTVSYKYVTCSFDHYSFTADKFAFRVYASGKVESTAAGWDYKCDNYNISRVATSTGVMTPVPRCNKGSTV